MDDDDLRRLLQWLDPAPVSRPVVAPDHADARLLLEDVMKTPIDRTERLGEVASDGSGRTWRRPLAFAAVGAAVVLALVVFVTRDDGGERSSQQLAVTGPSMSMCVPVEPAFVADMPIAFRGTATEVTPTEVVLDVSLWYASDREQTDEVRLANPAAPEAVSIDGVVFVEGEDYFVTATDGVVNGCGFSGPATAELAAVFDAAFGG